MEAGHRSPFNASGYYNNPEATARSFRDGWYGSGDLGYRAGSEHYVCGRRKDMFIVAGVNLYPEDLEKTAGRVPGVHPAW